MVRRVIHHKIMYMTDKNVLDLGMFTQVVHQLTALNTCVGKVLLPPSAVVRDKPGLFMKFSAQLSLCFSSSEEIKIVSC